MVRRLVRAADDSGTVFVTDLRNQRLERFDTGGGFLGVWGSYGLGAGQLYFPGGVTSDRLGGVYVTDNKGVQAFDATGTFLTALSGVGTSYGVATDARRNVYVSDYNFGRVAKFDASGGLLGTWGSYGSGPGQFREPRGVATDASGNVYVADHGNNRIQKFACP